MAVVVSTVVAVFMAAVSEVVASTVALSKALVSAGDVLPVVVSTGGGFRGGRFSGRHHGFSNDVFIGGFGFPGWWGYGYPYGYNDYGYYPYAYYGSGYYP